MCLPTLRGRGPVLILVGDDARRPRLHNERVHRSRPIVSDTALALAVAALTRGITVILEYVVFGTAWILGDSVRTHRAYAAELEEQAASAERRRSVATLPTLRIAGA